MRIRVIQKPSVSSIDGLRLDVFEPGFHYDVGTTLGMLFLAEGWAEPVTTEAPALVIPLMETTSDSDHRISNLVREIIPPYLDRFATAADVERRNRKP
jgi:hypothetical protein